MKNIFNYIKVLISIALLTALVWIMRDKLAGIGGILAGANKLLIVSSLGLMLVALFMQSYRLKFLLDAQSIHLTIKDVTFLTLIGQFFNNFMPTSIGGDVVKAYYASHGTERKLETFTSVAIDRMLGVITLMWVAVAALIMRPDEMANKAIFFIIALMTVIGTFFMAVIFNKRAAKIILFFKKLTRQQKTKDQLQRLYEATNKYRHHKILIFHALWLSITAQLIFFYMSYLLTRSIYSGVSFVFLMLTLPAVCTLSMLPSLNGLGIRESGFVYFLGSVMGKENAFALSLLYLAVTLTVSLIGGVVFLFKREFKHITKSEVTIK